MALARGGDPRDRPAAAVGGEVNFGGDAAAGAPKCSLRQGASPGAVGRPSARAPRPQAARMSGQMTRAAATRTRLHMFLCCRHTVPRHDHRNGHDVPPDRRRRIRRRHALHRSTRRDRFNTGQCHPTSPTGHPIFRPSQPLAEVPSAALHQQVQCPQPAHRMPLRRAGKSSGWLSTSTGGTEPDLWTGVTHPVALPPRATTLAPRHEPQSPSPSHRHHPTVRRIATDCIDRISQAASFLSTRTVAGPIADHGTAGHHRGEPFGCQPFGDDTSCTEANNPHVDSSPARRQYPV